MNDAVHTYAADTQAPAAPATARVEREPLTVEQVAKVLGLPVDALAREAQRKALGLVKADQPPAWCCDGRTPFFTPRSIEAAVARRKEENERLKLAREGVLPPAWLTFVVPAAPGTVNAKK